MSEASKSVLIYPFFYTFITIRFLVSIVITIPVFIICSLTKAGRANIFKFDLLFKLLTNVPLGRSFFSCLIAFFAPYTSSIHPNVISLTKESCVTEITDYPWLRNPFKSIHAIALANLGELCSGLVMMTQLQYMKEWKGIPTEINTVYYSKGVGTVVGTSVVDLSILHSTKLSKIDIEVETSVHSKKDNKLICKTTVKWTMGRKDGKKSN